MSGPRYLTKKVENEMKNLLNKFDRAEMSEAEMRRRIQNFASNPKASKGLKKFVEKKLQEYDEMVEKFRQRALESESKKESESESEKESKPEKPKPKKEEKPKPKKEEKAKPKNEEKPKPQKEKDDDEEGFGGGLLERMFGPAKKKKRRPNPSAIIAKEIAFKWRQLLRNPSEKGEEEMKQLLQKLKESNQSQERLEKQGYSLKRMQRMMQRIQEEEAQRQSKPDDTFGPDPTTKPMDDESKKDDGVVESKEDDEVVETKEADGMKNQRIESLQQQAKKEAEESKQSHETVDVKESVAVKDILDPENLEVQAANAGEATEELRDANELHVDEIAQKQPEAPTYSGGLIQRIFGQPDAQQQRDPDDEFQDARPLVPTSSIPPSQTPPQTASQPPPQTAPPQPPPATTPGEPTVAQRVEQPGEMVEEKFAYPGDMGMRPGATQAFAPTTMDQDDTKHRMRSSIKQLKNEIMCFRELYKGKIAKIKQLSRVSMANKTIDEIRSLHKQHSDAIKNYFTAHRGLRVGVIVSPSVLGINLQSLQNLLAPRVPIVQPPVLQARDTVRPRDPYAGGRLPPATRMSEIHYQLGGLKANGLDNGFDRDIAALNKGQDKQEDRRLHNRGTTRFGRAPVYKNYGYQNKKSYIASGITLKAEKPKYEC